MPAFTSIALGVGAAAAVAGTVSSISSAKKASKATAAATSTAQSQEEISREQWNRYLKTFAPMEEQLVSEVSKPVEEQPGFLGAMGAIERGYANTGANLRRTMAGRYPYGAGIESETQKTLELQRPRARAGVYSDFSKNRLTNMINVAQIGRGLPVTAMGGLSSAGSQYGSLAGTQSQAAASGWGSLGNMTGNMMQYYLLNQYLKQNPWGKYSGIQNLP